MSRINAINHETAEGKAKALLDAVKSKLGFVPNMMKTMANSPAVLEGYLGLNDALAASLTPKLREQIALTTAEENGCGYCLSAHTAIGKTVGLSDTDAVDARKGTAADAKVQAVLHFAQTVLAKRGNVSEQDLSAVRNAGYSDAETAEIVANVVLNIFTNYFNLVAGTEIDFPSIEPLRRTSAA